MRAAIPILMILGLISSARADSWVSREGNCGEWRAYWTVDRNQDNLLTGRIDYVHTGGDCVAGTGERIVADVRAVLSGREFFATRPGVCNYHGIVQEGRVRGHAFCAGSTQSLPFALRLRDPFLDDADAFRREEYWRVPQ